MSRTAAPIFFLPPFVITDRSSNMQLMTGYVATLDWNWNCKVIISDSQKCIMQSGSLNRYSDSYGAPHTHTNRHPTYQVRHLTASQIGMIYGWVVHKDCELKEFVNHLNITTSELFMGTRCVTFNSGFIWYISVRLCQIKPHLLGKLLCTIGLPLYNLSTLIKYSQQFLKQFIQKSENL